MSSDGYLMGEMERIALAAANSDLRSDLLAARQESERLRATLAKIHCPTDHIGHHSYSQDVCQHDKYWWPCPTWRALSEGGPT